MIDRYLDDEAFRAYSEALDKGKAELTAKAKARAKKATARPLARLAKRCQGRCGSAADAPSTRHRRPGRFAKTNASAAAFDIPF